jgi:UDP-N-acetylmuramate dehydrogenase
MSLAAFRRWAEENQREFSGQLLWDEPLQKHTYYRIGGPAGCVASPKAREDILWLARGIAKSGVRVFVLGLGSNLLVSDSGFDGLVVKCGRINLDITPLSPTSLRTGGSVAVSTLLRRAALEGWGGLEFLTGVPGSIGGVVFMNGGTHLGEAKDCLLRVEVLPLLGGGEGPLEFKADGLKYEYRKNSYLPEGAIVWSADWRIEARDPAVVKSAIDELLLRRKSTQPVDLPSCGSVFKNPKKHGISAWQVIDKLGLRGHRIGGAQFSEKHSNFIVNTGGARATDVRGLIELAKARARSELSIELEEEVRYLGDFNLP